MDGATPANAQMRSRKAAARRCRGARPRTGKTVSRPAAPPCSTCRCCRCRAECRSWLAASAQRGRRLGRAVARGRADCERRHRSARLGMKSVRECSPRAEPRQNCSSTNEENHHVVEIRSSRSQYPRCLRRSRSPPPHSSRIRWTSCRTRCERHPYGAPIALDHAQAAINAALAESRKRGWKLNVPSWDSGGNLVASHARTAPS